MKNNNSSEDYVLRNDGFCYCCDANVTFKSRYDWLRDHYICSNCGSVPRERALMYCIEMFYPTWRDLIIHESSPGNRGASKKLKHGCNNYLATQYFSNTSTGKIVKGYLNQNLEHQTFEDESFDIIITQDVFEHIFNPEKAFREIARTLKNGGAHIFTVPLVNKHKASERWALLAQDGAVNFLKSPEYHGNPIDEKGSPVAMHWGYDICDFIFQNSGLYTSIIIIDNIDLGIRAEYIEVLISRKDTCAMSVKISPQGEGYSAHLPNPQTNTPRKQSPLDLPPLDKHPYAQQIMDNFDADKYLNNYPDLAKAFNSIEEALNHFRHTGYYERRMYNWSMVKNFDPEYYMHRYPELGLTSNNDALIHYAYWGVFEGRFPNKIMADSKLPHLNKHPYRQQILDNFNALEYRKTYPDLAKALKTDEEALEHFLYYGYYEHRLYNRSIVEYFEPEYYIRKYPELSLSSKDDALIHYAYWGFFEGRFANETTDRHYNARIHLFQMGKVGSKTIQKAIERFSNEEVIHIHWKHLYEKDFFHVCLPYEKILVHERKNPCLVISGVRDIVSRIVSGRFQDYESRGRNRTEMTFSLFIDEFNEWFNTDADNIFNWFDHQYYCGLDVYAYPFDYQKGYTIISNKYIRLFLYRQENLSSLAHPLGNFLNIPGLIFSDSSNTAKSKWYSDVYKRVMTELVLPEQRLIELYNSRYMHHFYSRKERKAFIKFWSKPRKDDKKAF
jgi:hypothetical protein